MSSDNVDQSGFEAYPEMGSSRLPDFGVAMAQRLAPKLTQPNLPGFDPHAMMVKKNQVEKGEVLPDTTPVVKHNEDDVKALEDFCKEMGIVGFNCGRMNPAAALFMLKQKMGYAGVPLEERIPMGYQKKGTPNAFSANYPYQLPQDKRKVLNG